MKKILSLFLILILCLTVVGCSKGETYTKSKEQLKTETKLELEREKSKNRLKADVYIKDMDGLYGYVKKEIVNISREQFDTWEIYHFDITEDGTDEAVLVSIYGENWYKKMEIISADTGEYKRIPSDIHLAKYSNIPDYKDGFLSVKSKSGSSGMHYVYMDLFTYNGIEMEDVLTQLLVEESVGGPNVSYDKKGRIDGKLSDFVYTLTKSDNLTEKETIEANERYTYNEITKSFDILPVKQMQHDISKGYKYKIEDGSLKVTFIDTGTIKTLIFANSSYNVTKIYGDNPIRDMEEFTEIIFAQQSHDNKRLYFTKAINNEMFPSTYYIDMKTFEIHAIHQGAFVMDISKDPYKDYVILERIFNGKKQLDVYDNRGQWVCDVGETISEDIVYEISESINNQSNKIIGFKSETINGDEIDFNTKSAVVVPYYSGINSSSLENISKTIGDVTKNNLNMEFNLGIFGEVRDIILTYYKDIESKGIPTKIGTLSNTNLHIKMYIPNNDDSYVNVSGRVYTNGVDFTEFSFPVDKGRSPTDYGVTDIE